MKRVFIVSAKRSAIGSFGGALKNSSAPNLCASVIQGVLEQGGVSPDTVDESIVGNVLMAGQGMGPGRQAAVYAGIPVEKPAYTVNMLCGSGMKSVMIGASAIRVGDAQIVLAGGMENMSLAPFLLPATARFGTKLGNIEALDHLLFDGLTDVFNHYHMGITAENIASKHQISREEQDAFALESQLKARKAIKSGAFKAEIIPIEIGQRKSSSIFAVDEYPRADASLENLSALRPAFQKDGSVTAGNSSGINDGASALLLASDAAVQKHRLTPLAEIIRYAQAGVDPRYMGLGPVPAIIGLLKKEGKTIKDIDLIELNEAFAAQSLGVLKELSLHYSVSTNEIMEKTNVNGGAIALGHPIGASGNRIMVTLLHEMKKRKSTYGLASLCIGGGMGTAVLLRNML